MRCIQNFLWKAIVYNFFIQWCCIRKFLWKKLEYKIFFVRALYTKFSLYKKISFKRCCIQHFLLKAVAYKFFFQRVLHAKFSLTCRFIQHFLWKDFVYKIFFEWFVVYIALYNFFSLKRRIQNYHCKCLYVEENWHLSIFTPQLFRLVLKLKIWKKGIFLQ